MKKTELIKAAIDLINVQLDCIEVGVDDSALVARKLKLVNYLNKANNVFYSTGSFITSEGHTFEVKGESDDNGSWLVVYCIDESSECYAKDFDGPRGQISAFEEACFIVTRGNQGIDLGELRFLMNSLGFEGV